MNDPSLALECTDIRPDIALAERLFAELRRQTSDTRGITRMSYGPGEEIAHAIVRREAEALGLGTETDAACNQYMTLPGQTVAPGIVIGSHLDSVPKGGNFDGAAGVLMGLSVISGLVAAGRVPPWPITVMAIRAEESAWFSASYIGSRAAFGRLTAQELDTVVRAGDGVTLRQAIAAAGGHVDDIALGGGHLAPEDVAVFLEPHIEQGPVLALKDMPLGIVTNIRGSLRFRRAVCRGTYAHSGTTPREVRRDAVLAVSELVTELDRLWRRFQAQGNDLTVTVGEIATDPEEASFSKVAGLVRFSLDVRSNSIASLDEFAVELKAMAAAIESDRNVSFDFGPRTSTTPARMHPAVIAGLRQAADAARQPVLDMPCGAGHDAATFAGLGVPAGMLLLRNENGSHNPYEHMDIGDFSVGAEVLMRFCLSPPDIPR
ncbi:MAG: hydantoinase/carbamoylase family amidase [Boseongicola sp. SB0677_bin_26]|nr:hydantoinase/carbamoylase family amidase [Boseongicola sp. SB0665_bin_10]MYG28223.1 hydantoinase/carbamoylase family amidase [Boseongicola sp. SB0677_bin_26]